MAELDTSGGGKKGGGKVRTKKKSTRVDLTAMVDLAFLLITFFILTTTLQKPKAMDLVMPDKDEKNPEASLPVKASTTMTILLGSNNKLAWFVGEVKADMTPPTIEGYGNLRTILPQKAKEIKAATGEDMMVIVKPSDKSNYNNLVTVMDELNISKNTKRAIVDMTKAELDLLKSNNAYN
jgi:biopolymer transport protein ExbD